MGAKGFGKRGRTKFRSRRKSFLDASTFVVSKKLFLVLKDNFKIYSQMKESNF